MLRVIFENKTFKKRGGLAHQAGQLALQVPQDTGGFKIMIKTAGVGRIGEFGKEPVKRMRSLLAGGQMLGGGKGSFVQTGPLKTDSYNFV